jgi:hypothetical protein
MSLLARPWLKGAAGGGGSPPPDPPPEPPPTPEYTTIIDNPTTPLYLYQKVDTLVRNGDITARKGVPTTSTSSCVRAEYCTNVGLQGGTYKTASYPIKFRNCSKVRISGPDVSDASVLGLSVNYSSDVLIESPRITSTADNGLDIGFNTDTIVRSPYIRNVGTNGNGIDFDGNKNAIIYNPDVADCVGNGILVQHVGRAEIVNGLVQRCKLGLAIINNFGPVYIEGGHYSSVWVGQNQNAYFTGVNVDVSIKFNRPTNVYVDGVLISA